MVVVVVVVVSTVVVVVIVVVVSIVVVVGGRWFTILRGVSVTRVVVRTVSGCVVCDGSVTVVSYAAIVGGTVVRTHVVSTVLSLVNMKIKVKKIEYMKFMII